MAGVLDYKFMTVMDNLKKLQVKMMLSGSEVGLGTVFGPMSLRSVWFVKFFTFPVWFGIALLRRRGAGW